MDNELYKSSKNLDISVIIVNYKSWSHLYNCLKSLENINQDNFTFEVIVVDNDSNDGKLNEFSSNFSKVTFIENSGNNGFANGCNKGAEIAKGNYLFFLNPDTIVPKDSILAMYKTAVYHPEFGIVSCSQKNEHNSKEESIRIFPKLSTLFGLTRAIYKFVNRKEIAEKHQQSNEIIFPDWVSGSIIFISRSWFEKVKGWNEDYWMYYEDVDLCKRISELGGKIAFLRNVHIIHNHGGASRLNVKTSVITKSEVIKSKHIYIHNHFKGSTKFLSFILVISTLLITKFFLAIIGLLLYFIPKLRIQLFLFMNLIKYYISVITSQSWLSKRSMNNIKNNTKNR